jgi:predicted deacylase
LGPPTKKMRTSLKIGDVSAAPGELKWGYATWTELRDSTRVGLPVMLANGGEDGPQVTVLGGTHPTEHIPIHSLQILLREKLNPVKLKGSIIAFPLANPFAQQFSEYVSPHDGVNMYNSYPGSKDGTVTQRFANFIWEEAARKSNVVIDQHENVKDCLYFITMEKGRNSETQEKAMSLAKAFGLTIIKSGESSKNMPGVYAEQGGVPLPLLAMKEGIPAFIAEYEATTDIRFNEERDPGIKVALRGLANVLKKLGMISGSIERQTGIKVMDGNYVAWGMNVSKRGGLVRRLVDTGVKLKRKTPIAKIYDPFGTAVETIEMPVEGYLWGWNIGVPPWWNWSVASGDPIAFIFQDEK